MRISVFCSSWSFCVDFLSASVVMRQRELRAGVDAQVQAHGEGVQVGQFGSPVRVIHRWSPASFFLGWGQHLGGGADQGAPRAASRVAFVACAGLISGNPIRLPTTRYACSSRYSVGLY
jgi:hypothetical protein